MTEADRIRRRARKRRAANHRRETRAKQVKATGPLYDHPLSVPHDYVFHLSRTQLSIMSMCLRDATAGWRNKAMLADVEVIRDQVDAKMAGYDNRYHPFGTL